MIPNVNKDMYLAMIKVMMLIIVLLMSGVLRKNRLTKMTSCISIQVFDQRLTRLFGWENKLSFLSLSLLRETQINPMWIPSIFIAVPTSPSCFPVSLLLFDNPLIWQMVYRAHNMQPVQHFFKYNNQKRNNNNNNKAKLQKIF